MIGAEVSAPTYRSRLQEQQQLLADTSATITIFCFAGRRANMELQLPHIRRILDQYPNTEYHIWNMARNKEDYDYLKTITGERIRVIETFYGTANWDKIYHHYTNPLFRDHLFVKIDDDVVFLQSDRFADFIKAIDDNRDSVISAKVVNNGACTHLEPGIWAGFTSLAPLDLLDVHLSRDYADMSHRYMFDHAADMLGQPVKLIDTDEWLSINLIGYDWQMGQHIASRLGESPPHFYISGRAFLTQPLGDEGMVNLLSLKVLQGFLACHLSFGPQGDMSHHLKDYAALGSQYLENHAD